MNNPARPATSAEVVARIDLFSVDRVAGHDPHRLRWETTVEIGRPTVERVDQDTHARFARQVDIERWELNSVTLPFDLVDLGHGHFYTGVRVEVGFDDDDVRAVYLAPDEVNTNDVPFPGIARTKGLGKPAFSWNFIPGEGEQRLHARGYLLFFLVQRPKDRAEYTLSLQVEAVLMRQTLVLNRRVATQQEPGQYRLSFATGAFLPL